MKNLLVGNGINIQFDKSYTIKSIIIRLLDELYSDDFPFEVITTEPVLLEWYIGKLFLFAKEAINGQFTKYCVCSAERIALADFIHRYSKQYRDLRITDIGFEDYYLIHDLVCHRFGIHNPEQYYVRESLKMAYYHSIYNHGDLDKLYLQYSDELIEYLKSFDKIFSINYDSNIENAIGEKVFHIHGHFEQLSEVYNPDSFRNHMSDAPLEGVDIDNKYDYLHSNAVSTYCGDYKQFQLKQNVQANAAVEKMAVAYLENIELQEQVDAWGNEDNQILVNLSEAIRLKVDNPELSFSEYYPVDEFSGISGALDILGLSPTNDYHLFEIIDTSNLDSCTFYYFNESEKDRIRTVLPKLFSEQKLKFIDVREFWRDH